MRWKRRVANRCQNSLLLLTKYGIRFGGGGSKGGRRVQINGFDPLNLLLWEAKTAKHQIFKHNRITLVLSKHEGCQCHAIRSYYNFFTCMCFSSNFVFISQSSFFAKTSLNISQINILSSIRKPEAGDEVLLQAAAKKRQHQRSTLIKRFIGHITVRKTQVCREQQQWNMNETNIKH